MSEDLSEPRRSSLFRVGRVRLAITTILLLALLMVWWLFMSGEFRAHEVASNSMWPTLQAGDRLICRKLSVWGMERGDMVIIHSPDDNGSDLIKRLVAMPGDTIEVREGELLINGEPLPPVEGGAGFSRDMYYPKFKLPDDQWFVVGDNRPESHDSFEFGSLDPDDFWGVAVYRYAPAERRARLR